MSLHVGIVGAGRIGSLHARNVARHPRMRVAGVYDVDLARAKALAEEHECVAVASLDALLNGGVDAVVVASSSDTHATTSVAVARAGKPLYLEKPIDLDFAQAVDAAEAIRVTGVPAMVGFNRRFDPDYRELHEDVRAARLGRVQIVQMTSRGPDEAPSPDYIRHSGGIHRDKSVHFFDLLRYLTGREAVEIQVMAATLADAFIGELGDVDTSVMQIRLDDGALCQIDNARRAVYGFDERVEIFGTGGLRRLEGTRSAIESADGHGILGGRFPRGFVHRFELAFANAIDGFARLALDGDGDVPTIADGIAAQAIAEAAVQSLRECRSVRVDEMLRISRPTVSVRDGRQKI